MFAASAPQVAASVAVPVWRPVEAPAPAPWFPAGGVILLLVLLAVAVAAWLFGPRGLAARRGRALWPLRSRGAQAGGPGAAGIDGIDVLCARRLDAQHRLYVVKWSGGELLVGVGTQGGPVVLDRRAPAVEGGTP